MIRALSNPIPLQLELNQYIASFISFAHDSVGLVQYQNSQEVQAHFLSPWRI